MARLARLCVPGEVHVLVQRGHDGASVFRDDDDRQAYVDALRAAAAAHGVAIHAYALTDTQVLMLATPRTADSLSRMAQALGRRYVVQFNRRHGRTGTLWDGRFRAAPIEAFAWFLPALHYVESAPVQAGLAALPWQSRWSSAPHHAGQGSDALVTDHAEFWRLGNTPFEREAAYRRLVELPLTAEVSNRFSETVEKGWPLGSAGFLARLAATTARPVRRGPRGRPRAGAAGGRL